MLTFSEAVVMVTQGWPFRAVLECLVASLYFGEREGFFVLKILLTFDSLSPREHFEIGKD